MNKIRLKLIILPLIFSLTFTACGLGNTDSAPTEPEQAGSIHIDTSTSTVELTIPKKYMETATQEELDDAAVEMGFQSITLQDDGSAVYLMTIEQHEQMMDNIKENIRIGLESIKTSKDYKNFVDITANEDYTEFTVTTTEKRLDMKESYSVLTFYMYGEMYNMFNGISPVNIRVVFVNDETGEVVSTADSLNRGN